MKQRLAAHAEDAGARRREDLMRIATWQLDAGGDPDPALLVRGSKRSLGLSDPALAERLASAARAHATAVLSNRCRNSINPPLAS